MNVEPRPKRSVENVPSKTAEQVRITLGRRALLHEGWQIAVFAGILVFAGVLTWSSVVKIKVGEQDEFADSLRTTLATIHEALRFWAGDHKRDSLFLLSAPGLREPVRALLSVPRLPGPLLSSPSLPVLRSLLEPPIAVGHYLEFFLIAPDYVNLASMNDANVGSPNLFGKQKDLVDRAFKGETLLTLPAFFAGVLTPPGGSEMPGENRPVMFILGPLRDEDGKVSAVLAFAIDSEGEFLHFARLGRIGQTGETYAFDRTGKLLTHGRFDRQLHELGLVPAGVDPILRLDIRDPGGNMVEGFRPTVPRERQPLTRMAADALAGNGGLDVVGYRDYRGVPVIGAWHWHTELGMGLAVEIDKDEAYRWYYAIRSVVIFTVAIIAIALTWGFMLILRAANRELDLAARGLKSAQAQAAVSQKLAGIGQLTDGVCHEILNPLNIISLQTQMLSRQKVEGVNLAEFAEKVRHQVRRITKITDSLLLFSRRGIEELQTVRIETELDSALSLVSHDFQLDNISIVRKFGPGLPEIRVNAEEMRQVFLNIVSNAKYAMRAGGTLTVSAEKVLGNPSDFVRVKFTDTGTGIKKEHLGKIFDPFFSAKPEGEGTGMGLTVAHSLVEKNGGTLTVESEEGRGATLIIDFRPLPQPPPSREGSNLRVELNGPFC